MLTCNEQKVKCAERLLLVIFPFLLATSTLPSACDVVRNDLSAFVQFPANGLATHIKLGNNYLITLHIAHRPWRFFFLQRGSHIDAIARRKSKGREIHVRSLRRKCERKRQPKKWKVSHSPALVFSLAPAHNASPMPPRLKFKPRWRQPRPLF